MVITLSNLKSSKGAKRRKKRVGRGNSSGRGTYSGRGLKGQRSRSGGKSGLKARGIKGRLKNIPKLRGFKSPKPKKEVVNLKDLEINFENGAQINPKRLQKRGLVKNITNGVKILATGELTKNITVRGCSVSTSAKEKIEQAGGKVV